MPRFRLKKSGRENVVRWSVLGRRSRSQHRWRRGKGKGGKSGKNTMAPVSQKKLPDLQPFDVEEVHPKEYEENVSSSGKIEDWREKLEFLEKKKIRGYITGAVVTLWTSFALICIIRFAFTGDALPLVAPALLSQPLCVILKFYYGEHPP